jgi:hypothetical protein
MTVKACVLSQQRLNQPRRFAWRMTPVMPEAAYTLLTQ